MTPASGCPTSELLLQPGFNACLVVCDPLLGRIFRRHAFYVNHGGSRRDLRVGEVHLLQDFGSLRPFLGQVASNQPS